ncbi:hypothetical protein TNCV_3629451 [Trichonephila clavipes]|nr:hypothetical protein TNCV_3629451 [Trichonephila clavipes]
MIPCELVSTFSSKERKMRTRISPFLRKFQKYLENFRHTPERDERYPRAKGDAWGRREQRVGLPLPLRLKMADLKMTGGKHGVNHMVK